MLAFVNVTAGVGTLRVSDSARAAVRSGIGAERDEVGFENLLRLDATLAWPTVEVLAGYGPRLALAKDIEGSPPAPWELTFLHAFEAGVTVTQPRYSLALRQSFTIGTQSFGQVFATPEGAVVGEPGATPAPGAPGETPGIAPAMPDAPVGSGAPIPLDPSLPVWSASSGASLVYLYSERWQSNFDAGFGSSGGNGAAAELQLPRLQTVDASTALIHELTRLHRVGGILAGQRGWSERSDFWLASLAATWAVLFTRETDLSLRGGVGYRDTQELDGPRAQALVPVGSATLTHQVAMRGSRARYGLSVAYEPSVDVLRAQLQDRLSATASASLATTASSITLSATGSQSFPTDAPDAARFVGASLALAHRFGEWLGVEVGGQLADQAIGGSLAPGEVLVGPGDDGTVWTVYLGLAAQLDPIRF